MENTKGFFKTFSELIVPFFEPQIRSYDLMSKEDKERMKKEEEEFWEDE